VEQAVAQVRGNGGATVEEAAWCERARAWARARGLLYLELIFPERLFPEGRLGFTVVAAAAARGGRRGGDRIRHRLHALLAPGGAALLVAERGGAARLTTLEGATPLEVAGDPSGRLCLWRRAAGGEEN